MRIMAYAWLADAPAFEPELTHAIGITRGALVLSYGSDEERDAGITRRAQEFAAWTVEATARGLEAYIALAAEATPSEHENNRGGMFAKLLSNISDQFYFSSGAFQDRRGEESGLATTEAKTGFLADNYSTLHRIADAGTPPTIHHLIELLEFLIPAAPPRVFDLVAHALLGAGKRHGYQFESLGADRFVAVIGRFLADYRPIFTGDERQGKADCLPRCFYGGRLACSTAAALPPAGTLAVNRLTEKNDFKRRLHDAQIPAPLAGHSLAWGCRFNRGFAESIQELARFLMNEPELMDISLIRANINLDSLHRITARYGFEAIRKPVRFSPLEGVHRFGENILNWLLTLACNSAHARPNMFWRSRQLIYLSRSALELKYIIATSGRLTPCAVVARSGVTAGPENVVLSEMVGASKSSA